MLDTFSLLAASHLCSQLQKKKKKKKKTRNKKTEKMEKKSNHIHSGL